MAAGNNRSTRSRDRAWLNDAVDRNEALSDVFYRVTGSDWARREVLSQACLRFLFVYENFPTIRTNARKELREQQERIEALNAQADVLIDKSSRRRGNLSSDVRFREFMALRQAVRLAESRLISDRALAAEYLSYKNIRLNAALLKLIEVLGNRDAAVAALAEALLNQLAQENR